MATQAFTPAQLASNIAFQTAKKAKPSVSTTLAPLQSLLNQKSQQSQAPSTMQTQSLPKQLPETGAKQSLSQFGDTIKAKYPQYANVDSAELWKKMLEKYPQYADKVETVSKAQEFAWWVAQSALETAKLWVMWAEAVAKADPLLSTITKGVELAWGEQLVQGARQLIQKWKEKVMQKLDAGKRIAWGTESPYYKWWKLLGDIAQTVLLPWPWGVTKWAWLLKGAWQLAKQWAIETAKFTAISEKRLPTPKELAYWVGGNLVLWWWGKLLWTLASKTKWVSSKIAEWIVWSNLKNPAMREKYIAKVWQTPEKTLLDEWIVWSLSSQAKQISEKSSTAYNATRDALKTMPTKVKSDEWLRITNKILEWVDETIPWIDEVIAPIKEMNKRFANGTATPMDLNDAKLMLARYENIYDQFGKVKTSWDEFEKKALAKMYNKMKTELEKIWEQYGVDLKSMNKETQKWEWLRALMDRAVAREAGRDMIWLSDYVLWWLTISDPMTAIPLALGKKFFSSPKVSSRIAKFLYSKWKNATSSASNTNMNVANRATKQGIIQTIKNLSEKK